MWQHHQTWQISPSSFNLIRGTCGERVIFNQALIRPCRDRNQRDLIYAWYRHYRCMRWIKPTNLRKLKAWKNPHKTNNPSFTELLNNRDYQTYNLFRLLQFIKHFWVRKVLLERFFLLLTSPNVTYLVSAPSNFAQNVFAFCSHGIWNGCFSPLCLRCLPFIWSVFACLQTSRTLPHIIHCKDWDDIWLLGSRRTDFKTWV